MLRCKAVELGAVRFLVEHLTFGFEDPVRMVIAEPTIETDVSLGWKTGDWTRVDYAS
jgi:hypothetical protein